ncbi:EMB2654 [Symbiodinium sp. CCMP2592]|nr:EMB2654 [Symbiodinium sp. CCMP2592]
MSLLMDLDSDGEVQEEPLEEGEVVEDGEIDEEQPLGIGEQSQEEVLQSPQDLPEAKAEVDSAGAETDDEDGEVSEKEQAPDERETEKDEGAGEIKDEQSVDKDLVHDTESEEDEEQAVESTDLVAEKEACSDSSPAISDEEEEGDAESLPHRRRRKRRRSTSSSPHPCRRHHRHRELRKARAKLVAREQKRRKTSVPSRQPLHENVNRSMREVYVGGLAWSSARQEVVRDAFEAAFQELEDYRLRYRDVKNPIVSVHFPPPAPPKRQRTHNTSTFVFVEFYDRLLARTALKLSGLRIGGRSARICPPSAGVDLEGTTLDIAPLRQKELLPFSAGPGAQLRCHVWLGNLPSAYGREERRKMMQTQIKEDAELEPDSFAKHLDDAILALPGLRVRYPEITRTVLALRISECGRFGFLEAATERIASTIIAGRRLDLANGMHLKTGWPVGGDSGDHREEHAAPPMTPEGGDGERLHLCKEGRRGPLESTDVVMDVDESDFVEKMECEVFLGGTQSLKAEAIWGTLTDRLTELPSFKREYSTLPGPLFPEMQVKSVWGNTFTYNAAIGALGKGRQWQKALGLFYGLQAATVDKDLVSYNTAINACKDAGRWAVALSLLSEVLSGGLQADVITFNAAIGACEKSGQWQPALQLFQALEDRKLVPQATTWVGLISACSRAGLWMEALGYLSRHLADEPKSPSAIVYGVTISACDKAGQWQQALSLLTQLEQQSLQKNVVCQNAAMSACVKCSVWQLAVELFGDLKAEASVVSYNTAIAAYDRGGQWQIALAIFAELVTSQAQPDLVSFNTAINACKEGHAAEARLLYTQLREFKLKADAITCTSLISACASEWRLALAFLAEFYGTRSPDVFTTSAAVSACTEGLEWKRSLQLFADFQESSAEANVVLYNAAISAVARVRHWRGALALMRDLRRTDLAPNEVTFSAAISACSDPGLWHWALCLFEHSRGTATGANTVVYTATMSACAQQSLWRHSLTLACEMIADGLPLDTSAYNSLITAFTAGEQWQRSLDLFGEMRGMSLKADAVSYGAAIKACENGQHWELALSLLAESEARSFQPDLIACSAALSACEKGAQWESALSLLSEMAERALTMDVVACSAAISACEKNSRWQEGLQLLSNFQYSYGEGDRISYNALISACCKGLVASIALELLEEMDHLWTRPDGVTFDVTIRALADLAKWQRALALFEEMVSRDVQADAIALSAAIAACENAAKQPSGLLPLFSGLEEGGLHAIHRGFRTTNEEKKGPGRDSPIINVRLAIGAAFGFVRLADARLASTAVALEEMVVHGKKVLICRPSSFKHDEGVEDPLDLKRAVLKPPPPPMQPPPAPKEESQAILDVTPPPPPMVPSTAPPSANCRLWIGNLPSRHSLSQLSDDEDDAQNGQPSSKDEGEKKGTGSMGDDALLWGGGLCQEIDISGVLVFVVVSLLSLYLLALTGAM